MGRTSAQDRPGSWSSEPKSSTLRQELAEKYPELSGQSVATALDQATRAAAVLTNNTEGIGTAEGPLVALLARDRLDSQRARYVAAARRIDRHRRAKHDQTTREPA